MTDDKDTKVSGCVINQNQTYFFLSGKSIHFDSSRELHIFKPSEFESLPTPENESKTHGLCFCRYSMKKL